jgi:zinc protease
MFSRRVILSLTTAAVTIVAGLAMTGSPGAVPESQSTVVKATLRNGLRVVIVRNTLAPVISTDLTYLVGSRDDPASVPGMAHAQEHMMFRGTKNLSTSELGTVATALGGDFNAETSPTLTQFEFTVPASNVDAVLRIESDRMRDILDAQSEWQNERGAIEQEVQSDLSSPGNDYYSDAQKIAFAGTSYAHNGVGTRAAFDRLTGPELKAFYRRWYAPNNAVFVIAGDVDPAALLAQIRSRFESIPARVVPAHADAPLRPLHRVVLQRPTTLVYPLASVGFRMPGIRSPDFVASYLLQQVLQSPRGALRALVDSGEALDGEWISMPYVPQAQLAFATAALGPGGDPAAMARRLEAIATDYARHGVPRELFETTKRQTIASQELSRNSISSLASDWATTIADDGEPSIEREQQLIANVSLEDVNRVAKRYLDVRGAIIGALTPSANASQSAPPAPPPQGPEKPLGAQPPVTHLPDWAADLVRNIAVPPSSLAPKQMKLANGITLIVQTESISDSVFLLGNVRTNPALQEPSGKEGVSAVLAAMYDYGSATRDRTAYQRAQDDLDTQISAGSDFGLQTTSQSARSAIALLADSELRPRFDMATFEAARRRTIEQLGTSLNSTGTIASRRSASKLLPAGDPALRQPTIESLQALTLDDVTAYYAQTMRPDLTTISVVGNISAEAAQSAVESAFGAWQATGNVPELDLAAVPLNAPADVSVAIPSGGQDDVTFEQIVTLDRSSADYYPLQLGNAMLGGGSLGPEQSRLFRDLRQEAGLVYSINSELSVDKTRSQFSIHYACLPQNRERIGTLIDAEIAKLKTEPAGDFELSLAKASIVRRTLIGDSSENSIASSLLDDASNGYPLDQDRLDARHIIDTGAASVQSAFSTYIHPENFVRVVVGPV